MTSASWTDRWRQWRNAKLSSASFHRFSRKFPLFRPLANRQAGELFDLVAGFAYSQVLYACVELDLFRFIGTREITERELARHAGLDDERARRLLEAAAALDLVEKTSHGSYVLGIHGAALSANPWIARFVQHHRYFYADLAEPLRLLKDEGYRYMREYWPYAATARSEDVADYTALMAASQEAVAQEILDAYDFSKHRCLLDVGGGNGSFLAQVAKRHPRLDLMLFDLPGVAALARQNLAGQGLARVKVHEGSFQTDLLPTGADVVSLVRVVHDHDDKVVIGLLRAIRRVLPQDGKLLVGEPFSGQRSTRAAMDAYFNLYFLAMGSGRIRRPEEIAGLGREAGFGRMRQLSTRMPLISGLLVLES